MGGNATDHHHLPLLITAGVLALVLLWPRLRSGPSGARMAVDITCTTLALAALLYDLVAAA